VRREKLTDVRSWDVGNVKLKKAPLLLRFLGRPDPVLGPAPRRRVAAVKNATPGCQRPDLTAVSALSDSAVRKR
jgi:hypothetical protein